MEITRGTQVSRVSVDRAGHNGSVAACGSFQLAIGTFDASWFGCGEMEEPKYCGCNW